MDPVLIEIRLYRPDKIHRPRFRNGAPTDVAGAKTLDLHSNLIDGVSQAWLCLKFASLFCGRINSFGFPTGKVKGNVVTQE